VKIFILSKKKPTTKLSAYKRYGEELKIQIITTSVHVGNKSIIE